VSFPAVALGDVAEFIRGVTYKPTDLMDNFSEGSIVCMRTANVQKVLDDSDLLSIPRGHVKSEAKILREGDLLVSTANSWNLVGKCCWVPALSYAATVGGFIAALRGDKSKLDLRYLYHWFNSPDTQVDARNCGRQTTNISNMDIGRCLALTISLPPLPEQRRIAAILDKADALRAKRREAIAKLDQLLQSGFLEMFGDPSRNSFGWKVLPLGELLADGPQNGLYKPAGDYGSGIPILRIDGFRAGEVIETSPAKRVRLDISDIEKYGLRPGDLVINRVNSPEHLGKPALISRVLEPTVFESNMMRMSVSDELIRPRYLLKYLVQQFVRDQIARQRKDSINQSSINQGDVMGLMINVPPIELQKKFEAFSEKLATQRSNSVEGARLLSSSFESLQKLAFAGSL
jgi:type I restriction enzyme S subunit